MMSAKVGSPLALMVTLAITAGSFSLPPVAEAQTMSQMPMMADEDHSAMHAQMMQHHMGASVMPFDLLHSLHIFTPLPDGGEQDVISADGNAQQIMLIRQHLKTEAQRRAQGDYATPARIHGASMPGLKEMATGAPSIHVVYVELPAGARIVYTTARPELVQAIHAWLDAQAHDHKEDAMLTHQ
ncbi:MULTISPECIES: hypothetical protein [Acetobacter]|uniref:hypothetical protein n=1 Tax=Acetobacter TaxID=434 RepID=UPI00376FA971